MKALKGESPENQTDRLSIYKMKSKKYLGSGSFANVY